MTIAAAASFASVPFVTSSTLNQMAPNAQTGLAGNVVLTALTTGTVSTGEIVNVSYSPAQISTLGNALAPINVVVTYGANTTTFTFTAYGAATETPADANLSATLSPTNLTLKFDAGVTFNTGQTIAINNVRINVSSFATVGANMNVTISSVLGSATVTNPTAAVALFVEPITLVGYPIYPPVFPYVGSFNTLGVITTSNCPASLLTTPVNTTTCGQVQISEAGSFSNAFETLGTGTYAAPSTTATQVILRISNIPNGLSLYGVDAAAISGTVVVSPVTASVNQTGSTATVAVNIERQDAQQIEKFIVYLGFQKATGATLPLPVGFGTVAATLGPPATTAQLTAVTNATAPISIGPLLYAARYTTPEITIVSVSQLLSKLLSTFNVVIPGSFNTGIAITNISATDPFVPGTISGNFGTTAAQPGVIKVSLFPADGSGPFTFTTSASKKPGAGLDDSGNLPAKKTWTVLLSDLLAPAGITGSTFQGFIEFTPLFSGAQGISYISDSDFSTLAQGYQMVVSPAP